MALANSKAIAAKGEGAELASTASRACITSVTLSAENATDIPIEVTYFDAPVTQRRATPEPWRGPWSAFAEYLESKFTNTRSKGASGYFVAAACRGFHSDANCSPTRVVALDFDDPGPRGDADWAPLDAFTYVAHTSDSHTDDAPRWRVWCLLDRAYTADEIRRARCPIPGAKLRSISQPAFVPTTGDDTYLDVHGGAPLVLSAWFAPEAPALAVAVARTTPSAERREPTTASVAALVQRWFGNPDGTNRLAGTLGSVLADGGYDDAATTAFMARHLEAADPKFAKHLADALRAAAKRRAGDRIMGYDTLRSEFGITWAWELDAPAADTDALWSAVDAQPTSVIERLHPNTLRRNPSDRANPWWLYSGARGVWEPVSDHAVATWVDRVDIPEARGATPGKHVRNRNAVIGQHQLELRSPQDAGDVLALPDGTLVELRTGLRRATSPEDFCTATAGCVPDATTSADAERVMLAWCDGDAESAAYLWRMLGYMLTGEVGEKHFWVLYGVSNTGKSSFAEVVAHMMAGHHVRVPVETWLASRTGQVSSSTQDSLRRTIGARLVTSAELPARPFDTGLVKTFTGGDRLTAAGKWKAEVDFAPRAKLVICGNNPPETSGYDEAFVTRLVVVPFTRVFPVAPGYWSGVLVPLLPQFLRRALAEARAYYRDGLLPLSSAAKLATNDVAVATDTLGAFLDEWRGAPGDFVPASALYESYLAYAGLTRERYSNTRFGTDVKARLGLTGGKPPRRGGVYGYTGFRRPGQNDELAGVRLTARGAVGRAQS